ncbi:MAG: hypothetical protein ACFB4I_11180 [Cyanophyceae cyanobacterium]
MNVQNTQDPNYDPNMTDAESAARQEREEMKPPQKASDVDTTSGYTVDREGRANNYAIEPEMYVEEPGDLREQEEAEKAARAEELEEVKQQGNKGPGVI